MPETPVKPPIAQSPLSVVLVVLNQQLQVEEVLARWTAYLETLARPYEVLVVEADSTDRTQELVEAFALQKPAIRVLHGSSGQGFGVLLRMGLEMAHHPLLCYAECSPSYEPTDLGRLLEMIDQVDLVSGFRPPTSGLGRWNRKVLAYWLVVRFIFGLRLKDVACPFKLFRRSIFRRIPIQSDGDFAHAEILAKANYLGCVMTEVGIGFTPTEGTATKDPFSAQVRTEAYRLFRRPDFGPPVLPEEPAAPVA